jgi:hypothetical protein
MSILSLMRTVGQGSREQKLHGEFKTNLGSTCLDIVRNLSNIGVLKPGLKLTGSEQAKF